MSARAPIALLAAAFAGSVGCALLAGLDGDRHLVAASSTGGAGGKGGAGGALCSPVTVPARPSAKDAGGSVSFAVALRSVDLGESNLSMPKVGLDLDGVCTCPGPPSCAEPSWAGAPHCDDLDGRDNATGHGFSLINATIQMPIINSALFSEQSDGGAWSILVRVSGYDGGSDDDEVEAAVYVTPGLGAKPAWDGTDTWPVADVSLVDKMSLDQPVLKDAHAYVRGGVLVASLPTLPVLFLSTGVHLQLDLSRVVLTAQILATDGGAGYRLTAGTLAATWKTTDLFTDLSGLRINGGTALCTDSGYYAIVKNTLCSAVDLSADAAGADAGCDALSFGMSFEAFPVQLGAPMPLPAPSGGCPAATDPQGDMCGN